MKYLKILLLTLVVFGCNSEKESKIETFSEDKTFEALTSIIDNYVDQTLDGGNVNSFALAIYKDGKMYQNYYGEIDNVAHNKPNDSSLFEIASITKTFTGSLIAKAVLNGKITLEDDIRTYFEGDYSNLEYQGHPITIKNLLTHSLGFKYKTPERLEIFNKKMNSGESVDKIDIYTIQDLLEELKTVEIDKKPGTVFEYTSIGPELLAYILEKVNQQSFDEQVIAFFNEIGMHNTYLNESEKHLNNLVRGYKGSELSPIDYCPIYGAAGGAISTLPDMAIYMQYLIEHKNKPWIKEASRILFVDEEDGEQIGYLWQNIGFAEEEGYFYSKTGTSNGTQSGILICPDSNYGIVLMVNNTSDKALNDWGALLFYDVEPDLIKYPKLNLSSSLKSEFKNNPEKAMAEFRKRKTDTAVYYLNTRSVNNLGYQLLKENQYQKAIEVFKFITEEFSKDANAYDSLGEAYFTVKDYGKALLNYRKSLELNPENDNAKSYIIKIEELSKQQS